MIAKELIHLMSRLNKTESLSLSNALKDESWRFSTFEPTWDKICVSNNCNLHFSEWVKAFIGKGFEDRVPFPNHPCVFENGC